MYTIIVGCGRTGGELASRLSRAGHEVVIIDQSEASFSNLSPEFTGFKLHGNAAELSLLEEAKIDRADVFVATSDDDNVNYMTSRIASCIFNVPRVLVRINEPEKEILYEKTELETFSPTTLLAGQLANTITDNLE